MPQAPSCIQGGASFQCQTRDFHGLGQDQRELTLSEVRARVVSTGGSGWQGGVGTVAYVAAPDGGCGGMSENTSETGSGIIRKP